MNRPRGSRREEEVELCFFFNIGGKNGWVVNVIPRAFYPPEETRYRVYRRMIGPQGLSGIVRKISPTPEFNSRKVQQVSIPTELSMLPNKRLITYKLLAGYLRVTLISKPQIIPSVQLRSTVNCHSFPHCPATAIG